MVTINDGKGGKPRLVGTYPQVHRYSYVHLASLGVLLSTVPVTRNTVPPYHLRPGGKTDPFSIDPRRCAQQVQYTRCAAALVRSTRARIGPHRSVSLARLGPAGVRKSMMYLIPACVHRPFFLFAPTTLAPVPCPTLLVLTLTLPWLLKRIGRARAKLVLAGPS